VQYWLNERLWRLFIELLRIIGDLFKDIDEMVILGKIIWDEKAYEMLNRLLKNEIKPNKAA